MFSSSDWGKPKRTVDWTSSRASLAEDIRVSTYKDLVSAARDADRWIASYDRLEAALQRLRKFAEVKP